MKRIRLLRLIGLVFAMGAMGVACGPVDEAEVMFDEVQARFVRAELNPVLDQYIVVLDDAAVSANRDGAIDALQRAFGGQVLARYRVALNGFAIRMPEAVAMRLSRDPRVRFVEQDAEMHAIATQTNATWGLDRIDQRQLPLNSTYTFTPTGSGVNAYVIDTGIRRTHVEFGGRALHGFTAINDGRGSTDCHGHGTHVAGTVGGTTFGVAKNVTLFAVRVLNCTGSGTTAGVIAGIDWVTQNAVRPAVANMSLGGGASTALDSAVRNSVARGVTYAVAAGNENVSACGGSPARVAEALTTGSTTMTDARSSFSNFGPCVDIFAPGSSITSAWRTSDTATNTISGTSMASPHVAGVVALYLQQNPTASPAAAAAALTGVATQACISNVGTGSPNLLAYNNLTATDAGPHCTGGGGGAPDPNSCLQNNACGGQAPGGCFCDAACVTFGDCCFDGPC